MRQVTNINDLWRGCPCGARIYSENLVVEKDEHGHDTAIEARCFHCGSVYRFTPTGLREGV